jgi:hypothetical protein
VVECDCGERLTLTSSESACERCGLDHATSVHLEPTGRQLRDESAPSWHYAGDREGGGVPC